MSITEELREYSSNLAGMLGASVTDVKSALEDIADRIDEAFKEMSDCWSLEYLQLNDMAFGFWERLKEVAEENAKLRELVSELWVSCPVHDSDCDECQHKGGRRGCELYDRMRELGVDA